MESLLGHHRHHLPAQEVLQLLEADLQTGLHFVEVKRHRERFGPNVLMPVKGKSPLVRFLLQFNNPLIYILLSCAVITAVIEDPVDALIIVAVVLINAGIGFVRESVAEQAMAAWLARLRVLRSRPLCVVPASRNATGEGRRGPIAVG